MHILFRADSSTTLGIGHVMRCLTLAEELAARGADVSFISRELPGNVADLVASKGFRVAMLPGSTPPDEESDAGVTLDHLPANTDWVVVDHYQFGLRWEQLIRGRTESILVLDDLANRPHDCTVLLDQNLVPGAAKRYRELVPDECRTLLGPRYALLRRQFLRERSRLRVRTGEVERVLIFFGGTDHLNLTGRAIHALSGIEFADCHFDVIVGGSNPHRTSIQRTVASLPNFSFHCQVADMAGFIARADLAVAAGGTNTWERSCLGLPSLVVATAPNQEDLSAYAGQLGLCRYLGPAVAVTDDCILRETLQLMNDTEELRRQSAIGMELVDGRGPERVVNRMIGSRDHR